MTKEDLVQVYACASALWPSFKIPKKDEKLPDPELEAKCMDVTWFSILRPYHLDLIFFALKEFARENDFCNIAKVGELCEKYIDMVNGKYIDEEAIFNEIRRAIACCNKDEVFNKLSPVAQEVVGGSWQLFKWGMAEPGQVETVIVSHIRNRIKNVVKNRREEKVVARLSLLKPEVKQLEVNYVET